jgi:hypothetical protein
MPQQKRKGSEDLDEVGQKQAKVRFRATTDSVPFVRDLEEQSILDPREEEWMQNADVRVSVWCVQLTASPISISIIRRRCPSTVTIKV